MSKFEVGDTVCFTEPLGYVCRLVSLGEVGLVIGEDNLGDSDWVRVKFDTCTNRFKRKDLQLATELIKEESMSLVQKVKDLTASKEDKLFKKYNVVDSCGKLTTEGNELLETVVFEDYKTKVVEKLEALEASEKKEKTK